MADEVKEAYELGLSPSPEDLAKTFGYKRTRRTLFAADSITYFIGHGSVLGIPSCTGIKITQHPTPPPPPRYDPSKPYFPGPPPDLKPIIETVTILPCTEKSYTALQPGTLKTALPRHDGETPRPLASPTSTPRP